MSPDERTGAIIWAIPTAALLVVAVSRGGPITLAGLSAVGWTLLAMAALVVAWLGSRRVHRAHAHGSNRAALARHEAGHVAAARRLGRLHSASITGDRGYVDATLHADTPLAAVTFLLAGQVASPGCRHVDDDADIRRELRGLPRGERAAVLRQARRDAESIVWWNSGQIGRDAARLVERGRL